MNVTAAPTGRPYGGRAWAPAFNVRVVERERHMGSVEPITAVLRDATALVP